ncbi:catalase-like isoform X2 [Chrysoperla carnea]|nr:catalase-like isoform X2 [Chrysoperla carnea]
MEEESATAPPPPRDPAALQLTLFKLHKKVPSTTLTSWGTPVVNKDATLTVGPHGPVLIQDNNFIDEIAHFDRERVPERVVHAKGAGAFGYFEVTHDITPFTAAKVFSKIGKRTSIFVRFSQVSGEMGYPDTVRDPRGFAVRFYTEDGMWDLVGNNTPIFFIRDPILFPSFIHTQKRNPVTHLKDYDAFWDFMSLRPESTHQYMYLFGDRGIPASYRTMNGYGSNTFKLINSQGEAVYCKFHYKSNLGVKNLDPDSAQQIAGADPDYLIRDLYNAIAEGKFPSWTFYIQVMTFDQVNKVPFNPFDVTKVWPHGDFPLIPVGTLVLNQNPSDYFAEVEQASFDVSNFVPGIDTSPDKMLQGRLFSYGDTGRYRVGTNRDQIPINSAFRADVPKNYQRDGKFTINTQGGAPNYHPNSFCGPEVDPRAQKLQPKFLVSGDVYRYDSGDEDNYSQPRIFYQKVLDEAARERLINNIADHCSRSAKFIQDRVVSVLSHVDLSFGTRLRAALDARDITSTSLKKDIKYL